VYGVRIDAELRGWQCYASVQDEVPRRKGSADVSRRAARGKRAARVAMSMLLHGTTRHRADKLLVRGPDPNFVEPGGGSRAENFSTCLEGGPFPLGTPEEYARRKAALFPNEGGPAILAADVPDDIIDLAVNEFFPLSQGTVQFDEGAGLDELRAAWPSLPKEIRAVGPP